MFLFTIIIYFTSIYLIYLKGYQVKKIIAIIAGLGLSISIFLSTDFAKQYFIYLIIIYIGSIFVKLSFKFLRNIVKSIDHRRKFTICFSYIFLYILALFLIINMTEANWLKWFYFLVFFILDFYYFHFFYWSKNEEKKQSKNEEWEEAITFAIIAATLIHVFFIQPFTIPTSSMENNMQVGDFLLVSKVNYGANIPNTPLFMPFMHQKIPGTNIPSYSKIIQLGYNRIPGFQTIKNNDIVVFNFPADSLRTEMPFDKKMNYVKRCVGIAGDSLQIINQDIYINNKKSDTHIEKQFQYIIVPNDSVHISNNTMQNVEQLLIKNDIETYAQYRSNRGIENLIKPSKRKKTEKKLRSNLKNTGLFVVFLTKQEKNIIEKRIKKWFVFKQELMTKNLFPKSLKNTWTLDNYGPIYIPKRGDILNLTMTNIHFYRTIIEKYEHNTIKIADNSIYINDLKTNSYEIKMNYYWMVGDNRHNSEDSRVWGFVPENHIVGKPIFTWLSLNYNALNKEGIKSKLGIIRWKKLFTTINQEGKQKSYLIHFLIFLLLIKLITRFGKKNKS